MHKKVKYLFAEYIKYIEDPTELEYTPKGQGTWVKHIPSFKTYLKWRFGGNYHSLLCESLGLSNNELAAQIEEFAPIIQLLKSNISFSDNFYTTNIQK